MRLKHGIKALLSLGCVVGLLIYLSKTDSFSVISRCSLWQFGIITLITAATYILNGFQFRYILRTQIHHTLSLPDTLLRPFSMSLFSYFIPANGGLLYSVFFFRKKYHVDIAKGFSIGLIPVYLSLIFSGLIGLAIAWRIPQHTILLSIFSIGLIASPWILSGMNQVLQAIGWKYPPFRSFQAYVHSIIHRATSMMNHRKLVLVNAGFTILQLVISVAQFWLLILFLDIDISLAPLIFMVLLIRISSLIRVLPGNLGLEELLASGIFGLSGFDATTGVIVILLLRVSTMVLFIPLGISHTIAHLHFFKKGELRSLFASAYKAPEDESQSPASSG